MLSIQGFEKTLRYLDLFWQGVVCTISLSALTVILGFILSLVLALCRLGKLKILNILASIYVEFFRATPLLVQLFIVYYVLFADVSVLPGFKLFGFINVVFRCI